MARDENTVVDEEVVTGLVFLASGAARLLCAYGFAPTDEQGGAQPAIEALLEGMPDHRNPTYGELRIIATKIVEKLGNMLDYTIASYGEAERPSIRCVASGKGGPMFTPSVVIEAEGHMRISSAASLIGALLGALDKYAATIGEVSDAPVAPMVERYRKRYAKHANNPNLLRVRTRG